MRHLFKVQFQQEYVRAERGRCYANSNNSELYPLQYGVIREICFTNTRHIHKPLWVSWILG